jgi:hypothetical protein
MDSTVEKYLSRYSQLATEKDPWNIHYQKLAESFLTRKSNFTNTIEPGAFLQEDLFDNTGQFLAYVMASSFLSMLYPDCARSVVITPVEEIKNEPGVDEYFRFVNRQMQRFMDHPKAGLLLALQEHLLDQAVFGTSGVGAFDGPDNSLPVVYEAWSTKNICVSENAQGFVDTIFSLKSFTVRQIMEEYGEEVIAPQVRAAFKDGRLEDKVEVLQIIIPRPMKERAGKEGVYGMSYKTCHIDKSHRILMRESGYHELPVFIVRFFKSLGEAYGRSPAMVALPDVTSLNALNEAIIVATEKQLDPPLAVLDDGRLGGGVIDTSAGAINVFNTSGRIGSENPIFPLYTVGELQSAEKLKEVFKESITQAFYVDRLLDLNNSTQMTAFETSVRNRMRGESLGSLFARQELELLTPLIERTFNILYRKGLLGVRVEGMAAKITRAWQNVLGKAPQIIPAAVLKAIEEGLDIYDVLYISPAKRFMQSEKLQGLMTVSDFVIQNAPVLPGLVDNVDVDDMMKNIVKYSGAPGTILRTADDVMKIRAELGKRQLELDNAQKVQQASEVARNIGQAKASSGGGNPPLEMMD